MYQSSHCSLKVRYAWFDWQFDCARFHGRDVDSMQCCLLLFVSRFLLSVYPAGARWPPHAQGWLDQHVYCLLFSLFSCVFVCLCQCDEDFLLSVYPAGARWPPHVQGWLDQHVYCLLLSLFSCVFVCVPVSVLIGGPFGFYMQWEGYRCDMFEEVFFYAMDRF